MDWWMEHLAEIVSALAIGTLAILLRHWLARRAAKDDRSYAERHDAYSEFLEAWKAREERPEDYSRSRSRIELLGSAKVIKRLRGIEEAGSCSYEDVVNTYPLLIDAMRDDLAKGPSEEICEATLKSFNGRSP